MLTDISNGKLLQSIWEEFFSIVCDWQSFLDVFLYHLRSPGREYGMLALSTDRKKELDINATGWKCIAPNTKWILNYIDTKKQPEQTTKKESTVTSDNSE